MKQKTGKIALTMALLLAVLTLCSACGENKVSMSKSLYVFNETDVTLESLLLDVEGKPLDKPIEVLSGPLEAGGYQEVVISLPEKQAKNAEWTVFPVTEEGKEHSRSFEVGDMNPHGDNPVKGFYVKWFESGENGHYSTGVTTKSLEEYLQSREEEEDE